MLKTQDVEGYVCMYVCVCVFVFVLKYACSGKASLSAAGKGQPSALLR